MKHYARKGVVFNGLNEVVMIVTPVNKYLKGCAKEYAKFIADELNDEDRFAERGALMGSFD